MTRVDELLKKYPAIPRDLVIKWEVVTQGVRDTEDLDKISDWRPAEGSYQSKHDDVTLKERVARRPSRLKNGKMLRPGAFFMRSGEGAGLHISARSPYEIREVGEGKFGLFEGEEKVNVDMYFPRPEAREGPEPETSKGTPISRLLRAPRTCFFIMPVRYCEYFSSGEQCKFCNFNSGQDDARSIGLYRPVTESMEEIVEAYQIRCSEVRLLDGRLELGGFANAEHEERIHCNFVEKIASATPYKPKLTIFTEALSRKGMQRLRDAGLDNICIHIEMWDPQLFVEILPGKAKHFSFERWLESLSDAVDVFGVGHVACKTLGGLSLIPPNGHKTWQEARDSHSESVRSMIRDGIVPNIGRVALAKGSIYGDDPSNHDKLPPTEYYLDLFAVHHEAMTQHGLYAKLDKYLHCGLCCSSTTYVGEIGILTQAGDWGNWMADVAPENWIRHFLRTLPSASS